MRRLIVAAAGVLAVLALSVMPTAAATPSAGFHRACAAPHGRVASCLAVYRSADAVRADTVSPLAGPPSGWTTPAKIQAAYKLPASRGAGQTIGIVDAFDNPKAESNLATFRKQFGLPPCTTKNGCFRKVNQRGAAKPLPQGDPDWGVEIALDLQAVSAACPKCHILLVEGNDATFNDLGVAENTAVRLGAKAVSNSYGGNEFNGAAAVGKKYYTHPGRAIVASSGDLGFQPATIPAAFRTTIAVGGTTLKRAAGTTRGWKEKVWGDASGAAGSGCSAYFSKPAWQKDKRCKMRTIADVSAVADPNSGLAVYDTYGLGADNGWIQVGGTSLSSPLIAGMIGLAGNSGKLSNASYLYAHRGRFYDVVGGSNALAMGCGGDYLCTGVKGYDGPSGIGTPHGVGGL